MTKTSKPATQTQLAQEPAAVNLQTQTGLEAALSTPAVPPATLVKKPAPTATIPNAETVTRMRESVRMGDGVDLLVSNTLWFVAAGQQPETPTPSSRQTAFYLGMQLEELAEKLAAVWGNGSTLVVDLAAAATDFKAGAFDHHVGAAMSEPASVKEMLDADIDLLWVSVGAARAQGADVYDAYSAIDTANWDKRFPDGTFHLDPITNKVLKPEGWKAADLTAFIHPDLRG